METVHTQACWHFGRHLINEFNVWDQQSGIHLPPMWRFLLRPNHLAETCLHSIQNQPHSDTSNTLAKHTAASHLHWHANKSTHYKGKTCWLTRSFYSQQWDTRVLHQNIERCVCLYITWTQLLEWLTIFKVSIQAPKTKKEKKENRKITDLCTDSWHRLLEHREHQYHTQSSKKVQRNWIFDGLQVRTFTDSEILQTASKASSYLGLMLNFDVKCPMSIIQMSCYPIKTL